MSVVLGPGLRAPERSCPASGWRESRLLPALALRNLSLWRGCSQDGADVLFGGPLGFPLGASMEEPCVGCTVFSSTLGRLA